MSRSGHTTAEETAADLASSGISLVLCGSDEASVETANLVAASTGAKVRTVDGLGEVHLSLWEGLRSTDLEERFPSACRQWLDDPAIINAPDGESLLEARARIVGALTRTLERIRAGTTVGVVLRPIALGIVRCWLASCPTCQLWTEVNGAPASEPFEIPRVRLRASAQAASTR